ncbi:Fc.00g058840.m01.CDS01 [Cosmosporella sp. VM-42]
MASTVILGSGIIGLSTAHYLSKHQPGSTIHLVDSSAELFASASGYAGGFLAKDWFPPALNSLAELSYEEHRKLAENEGGRETWAYSKCVTVSYEPKGKRDDGKCVEDWLLGGTSRAELVTERKKMKDGEIPKWLRRVDGDAVDVVDGDGGTAIVDPLRFCQFLLSKCKAAGVQFHYPAIALEVRTDVRGELSNVRIGYTDSSTETEIPATRLLISAGAWTPQVFTSLFNTSSINIPISGLAGHSLVVRNPGEVGEVCHAVYCELDAFSPEIYSRPNGDIYLAGVNSANTRLPDLATGAKPIDASLNELKKIAKQLIASDKELEVVRTGLCFRPITERGLPYVLRMKDENLGIGMETRLGQEGGVFVAAGHGPWGISLGLGTGKVMAEMMQGSEMSADVSALGL